MDYYSVTRKSLSNFLRFPQILLPNILYLVIQLFSGAIFFSNKNIQSLFSLNNLETSIREELAKQLTGWALLQVIASFIIFALFTFFISVGIEALKFNMMAQIVQEKRCSLRKAWKERFKNYIKLGLLKLLIYILTFTIAAIIASPLFTAEISKIKILGLVIAIIIALIIKVAILFSYQYIFLLNEGPMQALGHSILHFKRKTWHSVSSWAIITAIEVIFAIIGLVFIYGISGTAGTLLVSLAYILYKVWSEMFLFESLNATKH